MEISKYILPSPAWPLQYLGFQVPWHNVAFPMYFGPPLQEILEPETLFTNTTVIFPRKSF
jgi:hypothetical protein